MKLKIKYENGSGNLSILGGFSSNKTPLLFIFFGL